MDPDAALQSMATLTLADLEDEDEIRHVGNVQVRASTGEKEFYAIRRLLTNKTTKFAFFRDTMTSVWQPAMGMNVKELLPGRYLFRFYHESDISRIIEDGPWAFEQNLLILKRISGDEDSELVPLDNTDFWIQVHGLPAGLRPEAVLEAIGGFIGRVTKLDERNFDGAMRVFFRVKVEIDV
ncbi:PREDICTED: uncharacterized protein LOC109150754 [Ipomoea nil]|uniref:uncharacterized protein LOC109150754 n=1 Tax=Ipomoea nil TaxID=35883 RepID=UPI000901967A|nr:PREDICTED: uncharacterized protein LOC109150754 [Ipomoea nil]